MTAITTQEQIDKALAAAEAARSAFTAAVRDGRNGYPEYSKWKVAVEHASELGARPLREALEAEHRKCQEHARLRTAANLWRAHADGRCGAGLPAAEVEAERQAWCRRASDYAGYPVGEVNMDLLDMPARVRGADYPVRSAPAVPSYTAALAQACA